jgi:hypothetical protein
MLVSRHYFSGVISDAWTVDGLQMSISKTFIELICLAMISLCALPFLLLEKLALTLGLWEKFNSL